MPLGCRRNYHLPGLISEAQSGLLPSLGKLVRANFITFSTTNTVRTGLGPRLAAATPITSSTCPGIQVLQGLYALIALGRGQGGRVGGEGTEAAARIP